jgi:hypothetical protein
MELVRAWDDGWRMFHVFTGRKYITLLDVGTLRSKRKTIKKYKEMSPKLITDIPIRRTINKLKKRTAEWKRLNIWHSAGLCQQFIKRWEAQL